VPERERPADEIDGAQTQLRAIRSTPASISPRLACLGTTSVQGSGAERHVMRKGVAQVRYLGLRSAALTRQSFSMEGREPPHLL